MRMPIALALALSACDAAKDGGAPSEPGEICAEEGPTRAFVQLDLPEGTLVTEEDLIWQQDGNSGYCVQIADSSWECDTEPGGVEIRIAIAGHKLHTESVEVPESGCMPSVQPELERLGEPFAEDRSYFIEWYPEGPECDAAIARGVNCTAHAVFCADGDAMLMITDITYQGIYAADGLQVPVFLDGGGGEFSEDVRFEIVSDVAVRDSDFGYTWELDTEDRYAPMFCRPGGR